MTAINMPSLAIPTGPDVRFKSRQSIGFNITSGVTLKFDYEIYDTTDSFNPATGYFSAPQAGAYRISIQVMGTSQSAGQRIEIDLMDVASSGMLATTTGNYSTAAAQGISAFLVTTVYLNAGQQIVVNVSSNSGTITGYAWGGGDGTYFNAELNSNGAQGAPGPSLPVYANAAARDVAMPSPTRGQQCFVLAGAYPGTPAGLQQYNGPTVGWTRDWGAAWGEMATVQLTAAPAAVGPARAPVAGYSFTYQHPANRLCRISFACWMQLSVANTGGRMSIYQDSTMMDWAGAVIAAVGGTTGTVTCAKGKRWVSDGLSHVWSMQAECGSGTIIVASASNYPSWLTFDDMGPAGDAP